MVSRQGGGYGGHGGYGGGYGGYPGQNGHSGYNVGAYNGYSAPNSWGPSGCSGNAGAYGASPQTWGGGGGNCGPTTAVRLAVTLGGASVGAPPGPPSYHQQAHGNSSSSTPFGNQEMWPPPPPPAGGNREMWSPPVPQSQSLPAPAPIRGYEPLAMPEQRSQPSKPQPKARAVHVHLDFGSGGSSAPSASSSKRPSIDSATSSWRVDAATQNKPQQKKLSPQTQQLLQEAANLSQPAKAVASPSPSPNPQHRVIAASPRTSVSGGTSTAAAPVAQLPIQPQLQVPQVAAQKISAKPKTLKFGQRESYELADSPSAGHKTNISSISPGSSKTESFPEDGDKNCLQIPIARQSVKRVSVVSVPSPTSSANLMGHRSSVQSCVSEYWEDETIDEDQVKAAQKLANKLALRRGQGTAAKK